jgi:serine protease Do
MPRFWWSLLVLPLVALSVSAQDLPDELQALDRAFQKAIARADRSVVCLLVGRDEAYDKFEEKKTREPGVLGKFDAPALLAKAPEGENATRRRIADLDMAAPGFVPEACGTGIIIDKAGLILTPGHVVARAKKVFVKLPGGKGSYADIHALDPRSDLAVLRLIDPPEGLEPAVLGDGGAVRKGQLVLLLANPFAPGFREPSPTASWGMVANLRRRLPLKDDSERARHTLHHHGTLLQIESKLNLTTSGGAVLNLSGEVVGLTTAQAAVFGGDAPGGFAIPLDEGMRRIIEVLRKGEEVEYGFLGVSPGMAQPGRGVEVNSAQSGSPAERGGLRGHEVILRIDGRRIQDADDLFLEVGTHLAGTKVKLEFQTSLPRPEVKTVEVTLAKFWVPTPGIVSRQPAPSAGLRVDWTSVLNQRRNSKDTIPVGVLIREVVPGSSAEQKGLQVDEVISQVGSTPVTTPEEFYRAMAGKGPIIVTIKDETNKTRTVTLTR